MERGSDAQGINRGLSGSLHLHILVTLAQRAWLCNLKYPGSTVFENYVIMMGVGSDVGKKVMEDSLTVYDCSN